MSARHQEGLRVLTVVSALSGVTDALKRSPWIQTRIDRISQRLP